MARPRFAPSGARSNAILPPKFGAGTGRRVKPPRFQSTASTGLLDRLSSEQRDQLRGALLKSEKEGFVGGGISFSEGPKAREREYLELAKKFGLSEGEAVTAKPILKAAADRDRPSTALRTVGRVFQGVESTMASVIGSQMGGGAIWEDDWEPPWVKIHKLGKGFTEIPKAIGEKYTFTDALRENNDPNSFWYRHAEPIGLAMSIFWDPLTYLTVGATTASRLAVREAIAINSRQAAYMANKKIAQGALDPRTGKPYKDEDRLGHALLDSLMEIDAPITPGDAWLHLREQGFVNKQLMREWKGHELYIKGLRKKHAPLAAKKEGRKVRGALRSARMKAGAHLAPYNVQGGRGVRFAGMEIPGTVALGEKITVSRGMKGKYGGQAERVAEGLEHYGISGFAARHIAHDLVKAHSMVEVSRYKDEIQAIGKISSSEIPIQVLRTPVVTTQSPETLKLFHGGSLEGDVVIEKSSPRNTYGPGLYTTDANEEAIEYADEFVAYRYEIGETLSPEPSQVLSFDIPTKFLDSLIDVSKPFTKDHQAAIVEGLTNARRTAEEAGDVDVVAQIDAVAGHLSHRLGGVGLQTFDDVWTDLVWGWVKGEKMPPNVVTETHEFHKPLREAFVKRGFSGVKNPRGIDPENTRTEYVFWDTKAINAISKGKHPMQQAEENVLGTVGEILSPARRKNLLRTDTPFDQKDSLEIRKAKVAFLRAVKNRANLIVAQGVKAGSDKVTLQAQWETLAKTHADPLIALAKFDYHTQGKVHRKQIIKRMINDPRFAFQMKSKGQDPIQKERRLNAPDGFTEMIRGGKRYAVADPIYDAIKQLDNGVFFDHEMDRIWKAANFTQNWWKIYATTPNPAFLITNLIGAIWNNILGGTYNPVDYVDAISILYRARLETAAEQGRGTLLAPEALKGLIKGEGLRKAVPESTEFGRASARVVGEAEVRRGMGQSSFIWAETTGTMPAGMRQPDRSIKERLTEMPPELEGKKFAGTRLGVKRGRQATATALAATANPLAVIGFAPELARGGRVVSGTIEDVVRLAPFMKAARNPQLQQFMEAFGPVRIPGLKHPGFTKAHQAAMYNIGAEMSRTFQFDYTDLAPWERTWAKTVFPFWVWYKNNFLLQVKHVVHQPRGILTAQKVANYIEDQGEEVEPFQALLQEYFDNLGAFQIPVPKAVRNLLGLPKDQPLYLNPKLPFVALNTFPPLWQVFQDSDTPTPQKMMAAMAPVFGSVGPHAVVPGLKIAMEAMVNRQLGLARPIDFQRANSNDWRNSYVDAPGWYQYLPRPIKQWMGYETADGGWRMTATSNYVLSQLSTPFVSNFGQSIPIGADEADRDKSRANLVSWLTGVRLMPVDLHKLNKNYAYRLRNMLEARRSERRERGLELEPEDYQLLIEARLAIKTAEAVEEINERELGYEGLRGE